MVLLLCSGSQSAPYLPSYSPDRLLKLGRAALIYLSLGIHWEERRRRNERGDWTNFPMELDSWDDTWKT